MGPNLSSLSSYHNGSVFNGTILCEAVCASVTLIVVAFKELRIFKRAGARSSGSVGMLDLWETEMRPNLSLFCTV